MIVYVSGTRINCTQEGKSGCEDSGGKEKNKDKTVDGKADRG